MPRRRRISAAADDSVAPGASSLADGAARPADPRLACTVGIDTNGVRRVGSDPHHRSSGNSQRAGRFVQTRSAGWLGQKRQHWRSFDCRSDWQTQSRPVKVLLSMQILTHGDVLCSYSFTIASRRRSPTERVAAPEPPPTLVLDQGRAARLVHPRYPAGTGQKRWVFQSVGGNVMPTAEVHLGNVGFVNHWNPCGWRTTSRFLGSVPASSPESSTARLSGSRTREAKGEHVHITPAINPEQLPHRRPADSRTDHLGRDRLQ